MHFAIWWDTRSVIAAGQMVEETREKWRKFIAPNGMWRFFFFLISPAMIWVIASCIASVFPSGLALSPPISLAECRFTVGATNRPPPTSIERTEFASYFIHTKIVICDFNSNIYALSPHSHIYWNFQFWPLSDSRHHWIRYDVMTYRMQPNDRHTLCVFEFHEILQTGPYVCAWAFGVCAGASKWERNLYMR